MDEFDRIVRHARRVELVVVWALSLGLGLGTWWLVFEWMS